MTEVFSLPIGVVGYERGCLLLCGLGGYWLNYGTSERCEFRRVDHMSWEELHGERMRLLALGDGY